MFIIRNKKIFISISVVLVVISLALIAIFGLRPGIDFKGGALLQVAYEDVRPSVEEIQPLLANAQIGEVFVQPYGEKEFILKSRELTDAERTKLISAVSTNGNTATLVSFTSIGPSVGHELTKKAITSIILVSLAIVLFIAYAFRKVSEPVASWKYGLIAIGTLLHDVIIPTGVFAVISYMYGTEIDTLFVVALLTILGLSVSDTIVVFDRIRENLKNKKYDTFEETVGQSINQTFTRSINTSMTVILVLLALVFFGPSSTRVFAMMLTAGMFFGTYSSIFLASPLLVLVAGNPKKK
jgi:preprotein translocase subunit SecF